MTDYLEPLLDEEEEREEEMDWLLSRTGTISKKQERAALLEEMMAAGPEEYPEAYGGRVPAGREPAEPARRRTAKAELLEPAETVEGGGAASEAGQEDAPQSREDLAEGRIRQSEDLAELWAAGSPQAARYGSTGRRQNPEGAGWLYRQVARGLAAGRGPFQPGAGLRPLAQGTDRTAGDALSPEGIDRFFQRDARRYDSGFTLY